MSERYAQASLDLIENVFTAWRDPEEGRVVRALTEEIRSKKYYVPKLSPVCCFWTPSRRIPSFFIRPVDFTPSMASAKILWAFRWAKEIRSKKYYVPELELVMVDETDQVIGYVMFSRFHLASAAANWT